MELKFVDQGANDRHSRKAIRSHVMKGKNAGRKVQRGRKHASALFQDVAALVEPDTRTASSEIFPELAEMESGIRSSNRFNGSEYAYFQFPVQFTPSMRYMVHQFHHAVGEAMYPMAFCRPSGEQPWFRFMLTDQAFLHCLLAMTATFLSLFHKPGTETLEATKHLSQTIRLVNRDLSTDAVPRDPTVAAVVSLGIYCNLIGNPDNAVVHLNGLEHMLNLRPGGIVQMRESNLSLVHKICRTDIDVSIAQGSRPRFGRKVAAVQHAAVIASLGSGSTRKLPPCFDGLSHMLKNITRDLLELCRRPGRSKMDAFQFQELLISICYRLLDFAPLQEARPENALDDAWQIGLLGFMTTIMYATKYLRAVYCKRLRNLLEERVEMVAENRPLQLWFLFVCALSATNTEDQPIRRIKRLANDLELTTWKDVRACLRPFPWIDIVHDELGREIWTRACTEDFPTLTISNNRGCLTAWQYVSYNYWHVA